MNHSTMSTASEQAVVSGKSNIEMAAPLQVGGMPPSYGDWRKTEGAALIARLEVVEQHANCCWSTYLTLGGEFFKLNNDELTLCLAFCSHRDWLLHAFGWGSDPKVVLPFLVMGFMHPLKGWAFVARDAIEIGDRDQARGCVEQCEVIQHSLNLQMHRVVSAMREFDEIISLAESVAREESGGRMNVAEWAAARVAHIRKSQVFHAHLPTLEEWVGCLYNWTTSIP